MIHYYRGKWVALIVEIAFHYLAKIILSGVVKTNKVRLYSSIDLWGEDELAFLSKNFKKATIKSLEKQCLKKEKRIKRLVKNKRNINEVILEVYFFAKLEYIFRSGNLPTDLSFFGDPSEEVIKTLEQLCAVFQEKYMPDINQSSKITYNPNFGIASTILEGKESGVIIDGTLYEIDIRNKIGYKRSKVARLMFQYLLNEISFEINKIDDSIGDGFQYLNINRIGFYKVCFGEVEYTDITCINKEIIETAKTYILFYRIHI